MSEFIEKIKRRFSNKTKKNNYAKPLLIDEDDIEVKDLINETPRNNRHLICDDNSENRIILRKYLEMCGCKVDEVENLCGAIREIKKNGEYNVIWTNISMPEMDTIDCATCLRNELQYKGAIITLTGYIDNVTEKECLKAGVNHIICKPFDKKIIEIYTNKYH